MKHCNIQIYKPRVSWLYRRFLKVFLHYKPMETLDPWGGAPLDPRGLISRIYVGDHLTLLHTKYISCGPHGIREEDF